MRRQWLTVAFVLLLAMDVRGVIELWERLYVHRQSAALQRLTGGETLYWTTWALVVLLDICVLWLTLRVAKRLRVRRLMDEDRPGSRM